MAKRDNALKIHKKSRHSPKTKKRLEVKRIMLEKKATKKKLK